MPKPLGLSDSQYSAVCAAVQPLAPADRGRFLVELAALLRAEPEIGDGVLARAIRHVIKPYFRPPVSTSGPASTRRHVGEPIE
jgi:hypothetical protein